MQAARMLLVTLLCWTASAAAQEVPSAALMREVETRCGGTLLPAQHATEEARRTIAAMRAYAGTGNESYYREALRRALHIAAFDTRDSSARDSRNIAWALALAHHWLSPRLDEAHKQALLEPLRARVRQWLEGSERDYS
ncbi:MAG TPA: hypothetical protein VFC18_04470 [Burkholderiales bacterium]|nr:hypothetical protein [Burkholderiales bacterium]